MKNLPNKISVDSSVLLAYYLGEKIGEKVKNLLFQDSMQEFFISLNGLTEIFYILCRKLDFNTANNKLETLINTNILQIITSTALIPLTGQYKCNRSISLSDCFVIGLAKHTGGAAMFAKKEREIEQELTRENFDVELLFLNELDI